MEATHRKWPRSGHVRPEAERFWEKVEKTDTCWLWLGAKTNGYGVFRTADGKTIKTHRWSYIAANGPVSDDLQLDHLCRVRHCVNPAHLEPVSQRENLLRGTGWSARAAAATHCPHGHPYDEKNTHITKQGYRMCRECHRIRTAERKAAMTPEERAAMNAKNMERYYRKKADGV